MTSSQIKKIAAITVPTTLLAILFMFPQTFYITIAPVIIFAIGVISLLTINNLKNNR